MSYLLMMNPEGQETNPMMSFLPLLLIIVIFYFFMIRPQMKRQKEIKKFRDALAKGDKVVTTGGIYGRIIEVKETTVILEVAKVAQIIVDKNGIIKDMTDAARQQ